MKTHKRVKKRTSSVFKEMDLEHFVNALSKPIEEPLDYECIPPITEESFKESMEEIRNSKPWGSWRRMSDEELEERKRLWLEHGCPLQALYGDDGEMQCGACGIDFKGSDLIEFKTRIERIERKLGLGPLLTDDEEVVRKVWDRLFKVETKLTVMINHFDGRLSPECMAKLKRMKETMNEMIKTYKEVMREIEPGSVIG